MEAQSRTRQSPKAQQYCHGQASCNAGRPLSEKALRRACHRINPAISVHGMGSTFRDWVGDNTKLPRELAELALAHAIKGSAEAAYERLSSGGCAAATSDRGPRGEPTLAAIAGTKLIN